MLEWVLRGTGAGLRSTLRAAETRLSSFRLMRRGPRSGPTGHTATKFTSVGPHLGTAGKCGQMVVPFFEARTKPFDSLRPGLRTYGEQMSQGIFAG